MRLPSSPGGHLALLLGVFVLTRVLVVAATVAGDPVYPAQDNAFEMTVFEAWGPALAHGEGDVPLVDQPWEYPAGAVLFVVAPALLPVSSYIAGFVGQMLVVDLAMLVLLAVWGRRRGTLAGAWWWVAVVPLLGPVALGRFDLVPTLLAAGSVIAAAAAAPFTAGGLLAAGAAVKAWPALLGPLLLALHRRAWRTLAGGLAVGAAVLVALGRFGGLQHAWSFLTYQRDRGLEVEALAALPLLVRRLTGDPDVAIAFGFGSWQIHGPGAETLLRLTDLGLVVVVIAMAVLVWRARWQVERLAPAARGQVVIVLAVVLIAGVVVTNKVLSPQHLVWLAGLVALALCWPDSPLRATLLPLGGALVLTHLVYPLLFQDLLAGAVLPVLLLAGRDVLLLVVLAMAGRAAWRLGTPADV